MSRMMTEQCVCDCKCETMVTFSSCQRGGPPIRCGPCVMEHGPPPEIHPLGKAMLEAGLIRPAEPPGDVTL